MDQGRYILCLLPSWHDQNCLYFSSSKLGKKRETSCPVLKVNYLSGAEFTALLAKLSKPSHFQVQLCCEVPGFAVLPSLCLQVKDE